MGTPAPGRAPRPLHTGSAVTFIKGERRPWSDTDVQWCAPTLTPPSARTHILSRHGMQLRCDRKPAAHTMLDGVGKLPASEYPARTAKVRDFTVKRPNHFTFYSRCKCKIYTSASGQTVVMSAPPDLSYNQRTQVTGYSTVNSMLTHHNSSCI